MKTSTKAKAAKRVWTRPRAREIATYMEVSLYSGNDGDEGDRPLRFSS